MHFLPCVFLNCNHLEPGVGLSKIGLSEVGFTCSIISNHPSIFVLVDRLVHVQPFKNIGIWKHIPRPFLQSPLPLRKNTVVRQRRIFPEIHCQLFWIHKALSNFCLLEARNDQLPWRYQNALPKTDDGWQCCEAKRSNLIPVANCKEKPKQPLRPVFNPGDEKPCGAEEINRLVAHLQIDLFNYIFRANGLAGLASNWPGQDGKIRSAHLPNAVLVRGYKIVRWTNDVKGEHEQGTAVHQDLAQRVRRLIRMVSTHGIIHSAQQTRKHYHQNHRNAVKTAIVTEAIFHHKVTVCCSAHYAHQYQPLWRYGETKTCEHNLPNNQRHPHSAHNPERESVWGWAQCSRKDICQNEKQAPKHPHLAGLCCQTYSSDHPVLHCVSQFARNWSCVEQNSADRTFLVQWLGVSIVAAKEILNEQNPQTSVLPHNPQLPWNRPSSFDTDPVTGESDHHHRNAKQMVTRHCKSQQGLGLQTVFTNIDFILGRWRWVKWWWAYNWNTGDLNIVIVPRFLRFGKVPFYGQRQETNHFTQTGHDRWPTYQEWKPVIESMWWLLTINFTGQSWQDSCWWLDDKFWKRWSTWKVPKGPWDPLEDIEIWHWRQPFHIYHLWQEFAQVQEWGQNVFHMERVGVPITFSTLSRHLFSRLAERTVPVLRGLLWATLRHPTINWQCTTHLRWTKAEFRKFAQFLGTNILTSPTESAECSAAPLHPTLAQLVRLGVFVFV